MERSSLDQEYQHDTLGRLSAQDEMMLGNPHGTPVRKVGNRICAVVRFVDACVNVGPKQVVRVPQ